MTDTFRETIKFDLNLNGHRSAGELNRIFHTLGATLHYDIYTFDRSEKHPDWQSESFAYIHMFLADRRVDAQDGADRLKLTYMMATVPSVFVEVFADIAANLAEKLDVDIELNGEKMTRQKIIDVLDQAVSELMSDWGEEPGSETLAIMMAQDMIPRSSS